MSLLLPAAQPTEDAQEVGLSQACPGQLSHAPTPQGARTGGMGRHPPHCPRGLCQGPTSHQAHPTCHTMKLADHCLSLCHKDRGEKAGPETTGLVELPLPLHSCGPRAVRLSEPQSAHLQSGYDKDTQLKEHED